MKKLLIIILLILFTPIIHAQTEFSLNGLKYKLYSSDDNNYAEVVNCDIVATSVIIPSAVSKAGTVYPVTKINTTAFSSCTMMESISIPESVSAIDNLAFINCANLLEINYNSANLITANKNIFSDNTYNTATLNICSGAIIDAITKTPWKYFKNITESLDACVVYQDCLKYKIYNKKGSEPYAELIGNILTEMTDVVIPEKILCGSVEYKVSAIVGAFKSCSFLSSVGLPNSIESIGDYAFAYTNISNIEIPESLIHIGEKAFCMCTNLRKLTIPESVKTIGIGAFDGCN